MSQSGSLDLSTFYPEETEIRKVSNAKSSIQLDLKSHTRSQPCPECHMVSSAYHSTYRRKLQDLPILGKSVQINLTAYRYYCHNPICQQKVFCETIDNFCGTYKRMTSRLEDFVIALAIQTSCEGASRICALLGIKVSGDTLIRLILSRAESHEAGKPEFIGVDDWAYRKGFKYGTIIVDGVTHKPIDLLDGKDGKALKDWLAGNKQVKIVTRDRANAYAAAIREVLPEAMQIADRFHLHQNLLDAVKKVMAQEMPDKIRLDDNDTSAVNSSQDEQIVPPVVAANDGKKN